MTTDSPAFHLAYPNAKAKFPSKSMLYYMTVIETRLGSTLIDHVRYLWTPDAWFVVISPYQIQEDERQNIYELGFVEIAPVHVRAPLSFLLVVPHSFLKRRLRKIITNFFSLKHYVHPREMAKERFMEIVKVI